MNELKKKSYFITGVPGFISKHLVTKLMEQNCLLTLLIEGHNFGSTQSFIGQLANIFPDAETRITTIVGDISRPNLDIPGELYQDLTHNITDVFHLAAITDRQVKEEIAYKVNVTGTKNILNLCNTIKNLNRFNHVSTCYVSGKRKGLVFEDELDCGQKFNNFYERSKFLAELEIDKYKDQIPISIFRPSMVVGDSKTGKTDKYHGTYVLLSALKRGLLPVLSKRGKAPFNIVPVDYVVEAMVNISSTKEGEGHCFHLADPNPLSEEEVVLLFSQRLGVNPPFTFIPLTVFEGIKKIKSLSRLLGMSAESLVYLNHMCIPDTKNTQKVLKDTDVKCPPLNDYVNNIVRYF